MNKTSALETFLRHGTILCDFDGTISLVDVTDTLLESFADTGWEVLESEWLCGRIGSRECMSSQIALLDASKEELDAQFDAIEIDEKFREFVALIFANGVHLQVVSDGLDLAIKSVLKRHGLESLPVAASRLSQIAERRWKLEFPHAGPKCQKASATCKCAIANAAKAFGSVLLIGDGASDFCVAHCVDFVLAKSALIEYARDNEIPHMPIEGFEDVLAWLRQGDFAAATAK